MIDRSISDELKQCVIDASEILRGAVSASEFKDYISTLLFFKYVSDVRRAYVANKGKVEERYLELLSKLNLDDLTDRSAPDFSTIYEAHPISELGDRLNRVFAEFERLNPEELAGVFSLIDFNNNRLGNGRERNMLLAALMERLEEVVLVAAKDVCRREGIGDFMNAAMETLASHRHNTEHITPISVSQLIAQLVNPHAKDHILDPFCGTAALLTACSAETQKYRAASPRLFGVEKNGAAWSIARMNTFIHGGNADKIKLGDTFTKLNSYSQPQNFKFDVIVTNPPWGIKHPSARTDRDASLSQDRRSGPKLNGDYTALASMLSVLDDSRGRMAVIVTSGFLAKGGAEQQMRRDLVARNLIDAVISLPAKLFYDTSIAAAILLIRMDKSSEDVLFIDGSRDFSALKSRNQLSPEGIEKLVTVFRERKANEGYSYIATFDEIFRNDSNLNVSNYVIVEPFQPERNLLEIEERRSAVRSRLDQIEQTIDDFLIGGNI
jgi:type I restriction enzyme M protein